MKKIVIDSVSSTPKNQAFSTAFKGVAKVAIFENNKKFATPYSYEAFLPVINGRIVYIKKYWAAKESNEEAFFGSIQKGFFKKNGFWHLTAIIGIEKNGDLYADYAENLPATLLSDELMGKQEAVRYAQIERLYPNFKTVGLVSLLTENEQTEVSWLTKAVQSPARYGEYTLNKSYDETFTFEKNVFGAVYFSRRYPKLNMSSIINEARNAGFYKEFELGEALLLAEKMIPFFIKSHQYKKNITFILKGSQKNKIAYVFIPEKDVVAVQIELIDFESDYYRNFVF